jgi:hypothetical protein
VLTLAAFAVASYVALVVCAFGFTSLLSDTAVITETDAGPLVGPLMVAAATIVLFIAIILVGIRVDATSRIVPLWSTLVVGVAATAAYLLIGALAYSATTTDPVDLVLFFGHQLTTLYTFAVFVLAVIVTLLYLLVLLRQIHGGARPLWPWERDDA